MFSAIPSTKHGRFSWNLITVWLEMLIRHMLPLSCHRKKLQNLSTWRVAFKFVGFESSWWEHVATTAREGYEIRIAALDSDWGWCGPSWIMSLCQPFVSVIDDRSRWQHCQSFVGEITQNILVSSSLDTVHNLLAFFPIFCTVCLELLTYTPEPTKIFCGWICKE